MIEKKVWDDLKRDLPRGTRVSGTVVVRRPFGFFLKLSEYPDAIALVDAISYLPRGEPVDPSEWPEEGAVIDATVVDHVESDREIKLQVSEDASADDFGS